MKQLIVVYQPHQNLRQHDPNIQRGYLDCFEQADKVYWLPTFLSRENPDLEILESKELLKFVNHPEKFEIAEMNPELALKLKEHQASDDMLLFMGAGTIDSWARKVFVKDSD